MNILLWIIAAIVFLYTVAFIIRLETKILKLKHVIKLLELDKAKLKQDLKTKESCTQTGGRI